MTRHELVLHASHAEMALAHHVECATFAKAALMEGKPTLARGMAAGARAHLEIYMKARKRDLDKLSALREVKSKLHCQFDVMNPCYAGRSDDVPGQHWGGGPACTNCTARALL